MRDSETDEWVSIAEEDFQLFVLDDQILRRLDPYAVEVRYPGEEPSPEQARQAVADMKVVRWFVRQKLGLD